MEHWTDRLSEYLDGDLPAEERAEAEAHLASCPRCASVLEELEEVVRRAESLESGPPPRDLWPEIEEEIRQEDSVIELGPRRRARSPSARPDPRRVRLTVPQLAVAALALVLVSGGGAWLLRGGLETPGEDAVGAPASAAVPAVRGGTGEIADYAGEIRELQRVLSRHRSRLGPNTVRVLERNLAVIDRAIQESREALEVDPGNRYLMEHLEGTLRRKVEFLREATRTLRATS